MNYKKRLPPKLHGNRTDVLKQLRIDHREEAIFILYLNYAVNNICKTAKIDVTDEEKVIEHLEKSQGRDVEKLYNKLADFLWVFKDKEPQNVELGIQNLSNGKSLKEYVKRYVKRIFTLRNYFVHTDSKGCQPFIIDVNDFVFVEGVLGGAARENVLHSGACNSKSQKLKLAIPRANEKGSFEYTRKGLIFLICVALYKDEAQEFCSMFPEMLEPDFNEMEAMREGNKIVYGQANFEKFKGLRGRGKSLSDFFTYYSYRRGRTSVDAEHPDFLSFTDIVGDLNKVPAVAYDYLSLDDENAMLQREEQESTESEANKRFKYRLHKREKDRFLSLAAAYCEDFNVVDSIRFKKQDISSDKGRMKHYFGKDKDEETVVRQNRHYSIKKDAVGFEFIPEQIDLPVKIKVLRSSMSSTQMKKLLAAHATGVDVNSRLNEYFSAYHRVLVNVINESDIDGVNFWDDKYLDDISIITGQPKEALSEDPDCAKKYISNSLLDFLCWEDGAKDLDTLLNALIVKLDRMGTHAEDFLKRHYRYTQWLNEVKPARDAMLKYREDVDSFRKDHPGERLPSNLAEPPAEARIGGKPICKDLMYPPKDCNFTDADYVKCVFNYLNLFLPVSKRFRQLPLAEQHRERKEDHLYQLVHSAVGKYSLDQKGLWSLLEKYRKNELFAVNNDAGEKLKIAMNKVEKKTLASLAVKATTLLMNECDKRRDELSAKKSKLTKDEIKMYCEHFGVKQGLSRTKQNLLKSAVRIDIDKWTHAYDYTNRRPYQDRKIEAFEHIASQVPFPNEFFDRLKTKKVDSWEQWLKQWKPNDKLLLRDFYNVLPLIKYAKDKNHTRDNEKVDPTAPGVNTKSFADFTAAGVDRAFRSIREVENRDKILLFIAMKYWERFKNSDTFATQKKDGLCGFDEITDLRSFFTTPIMRNKENIKLYLYPNDLNKPMYPIIVKYLKDIVEIIGEKKDSYEFSELVTAYREQLARDRKVRLSMILPISIFGSVLSIPRTKYEAIDQQYKDKNERSAAHIEMEWKEYYSRLYKNLSFEEYNEIVSLRNAIFHDGFVLKEEKAKQILKKIGIM